MANYAKVNNGIVEKVIVAESSYFDGFVDSSPGTWVETSETGAFRKNYAGVGMLYDSINEVFYQPQPYEDYLKYMHVVRSVLDQILILAYLILMFHQF